MHLLLKLQQAQLLLDSGGQFWLVLDDRYAVVELLQLEKTSSSLTCPA